MTYRTRNLHHYNLQENRIGQQPGEIRQNTPLRVRFEIELRHEESKLQQIFIKETKPTRGYVLFYQNENNKN